jgi:hypothetical protein
MATALTHAALTVSKRLGALPHVRRFYQVVGFSPPNSYLVHNSSINNLARGVLTRVFLVKGKPPPKPREGIYHERLSYFREELLKRFPSTTRCSYVEFLNYYTGRKRTIYTAAVESLGTSPVSHTDARVKAFVKAEFINSDDKPDPDPRVISPRDPRYNVEVGRFLRPVEHKIYGAIAAMFGEPTVLKGFNSSQIGQVFADKWAKYKDPVAIGLDASRFDQHVSVEALKWEHSIYNGMFRHKELRQLLKWQLRNDVTGYCRDGKLKYRTDGCRMSGDMNTALGNCLIMCALVHAYLRQRSICGSLANNGDDCTVIIERKDLSCFIGGLSEWFLEMGFNMKVEDPVDYIEGIEFCQTHPVFVAGSYIMVRNFPKAIAKDCLSLKQLSSPNVCKSWMDAVGQGGLSLTGGIPVYQSFYLSFIRAAAGIRTKTVKQNSTRRKRDHSVELTGGLAWLSRGMERRVAPIEEQTRYSFWLAFGTTPDQQIALEEFYSTAEFKFQVGEASGLVHLPAWFD